MLCARPIPWLKRFNVSDVNSKTEPAKDSEAIKHKSNPPCKKETFCELTVPCACTAFYDGTDASDEWPQKLFFKSPGD
jgi:hypothetical protein